MEIIQGRRARHIDACTLADRLAQHRHIWIDIGTGDGRFVRHIAETQPGTFALGIDACRENLRDASRRAPANALFVIANAEALPHELHGLATRMTINFPWGSLLSGLLTGHRVLLAGLSALARPAALVEIRLNGGALAEAGWPLDEGARQVRDVLILAGFDLKAPVALTASDLRACPTTWARRLAFGRDPRAVFLFGKRTGAADRPLPPRATVPRRAQSRLNFPQAE